MSEKADEVLTASIKDAQNAKRVLTNIKTALSNTSFSGIGNMQAALEMLAYVDDLIRHIDGGPPENNEVKVDATIPSQTT